MTLGSNHSPRHYHLTGIGGAGLCGLATILLQQGHSVSGSDLRDSDALDALRHSGAQVGLCQDGSAIPAQTDVVVASLAIEDSNPELIAARGRDLPVLRYPEAVGQLMAHQRGLCVAGTHGKTTVTAALAYCLHECGCDPTFLVGGSVPQLGASARYGRGDWCVVEACEYQRAFLAYQPQCAVVTNVEAEHMDYYRDEADVVEAFASFLSRLPADGAAVVCGQSPGAMAAVAQAHCPSTTYAVDADADADWIASDAQAATGSSHQHFHLTHRGTDMGYFDIALPGIHNVANSTAVVAVSEQIGLDLEDVRTALSTFRGAARRFEVVGEMLGVTVVDDFAHHPTELRSLLRSARRHYRGRRLVCVFQPHQYSRTLHFLDDFAEVLPLADLAIVAPIYEARDSEEYREAISAEDVAEKAAEHGADVVAVASFLEAEKHLVRVMRRGDVILTVGAGDVWKIAKRVVRRLRRRHSLQ